MLLLLVVRSNSISRQQETDERAKRLGELAMQHQKQQSAKPADLQKSKNSSSNLGGLQKSFSQNQGDKLQPGLQNSTAPRTKRTSSENPITNKHLPQSHGIININIKLLIV